MDVATPGSRDGHDQDGIFNGVDDPVLSAPNAVLALPDSFRQPEGRGSSASERIALTIRCLSFFELTASSSFRADGVMQTSYLATPAKLLDNVLKREVRLRSPLVERGQILDVLGECKLDGLIHGSEIVRSVSTALRRRAR